MEGCRKEGGDGRPLTTLTRRGEKMIVRADLSKSRRPGPVGGPGSHAEERMGTPVWTGGVMGVGLPLELRGEIECVPYVPDVLHGLDSQAPELLPKSRQMHVQDLCTRVEIVVESPPEKLLPRDR